jgi:hypothetical protein
LLLEVVIRLIGHFPHTRIIAPFIALKLFRAGKLSIVIRFKLAQRNLRNLRFIHLMPSPAFSTSKARISRSQPHQAQTAKGTGVPFCKIEEPGFQREAGNTEKPSRMRANRRLNTKEKKIDEQGGRDVPVGLPGHPHTRAHQNARAQ